MMIRTALLISLSAALLVGAAGCEKKPAPLPTGPVTHQKVTIEGKTYDLELALDDESRRKGLGGRESISDDGGMLFVFPYATTTRFVMRDCLVPIDIIFVGENSRVVTMHAMPVEPEATRADPATYYSSKYPVLFAIELKGGTLETLDLAVGDKIELPVEHLKAMAK